MVITTGRDEQRLWHLDHDVEAKDAMVKAIGTVDVRDLEMDMTHHRPVGHRRIRLLVFVL